MGKSTEQLAAELQAKAAQSIWAGTVWVPVGQLVRIASETTDNVDRWLRERKVFAIERDGQRYFPSYAFDSRCRPLSAIASVMRIFKDYYRSDESIAAWFESTSSFLGGARPRELVASDPERVLACAQDCVANARYSG